jgi:hypothetical protein
MTLINLLCGSATLFEAKHFPNCLNYTLKLRFQDKYIAICLAQTVFTKGLIDTIKINDTFSFKRIRLTSYFSDFSAKIIVFMVLKMILAEITITIITMPSRNGTAYFASTSRLVIIKEPCRSLLPLLFSHKKIDSSST